MTVSLIFSLQSTPAAHNNPLHILQWYFHKRKCFLSFLFFFPAVASCILMLSSLLFIQLNAQLDCSKELLKLTLKFILKVLLHISVIQPSSGSLQFVLC